MPVAPASRFRIRAPSGRASYSRAFNSFGHILPRGSGLGILLLPKWQVSLDIESRNYSPSSTISFTGSGCPIVNTRWGPAWRYTGTGQYTFIGSPVQFATSGTFVAVVAELESLAEGGQLQLWCHWGSEASQYVRIRKISGVPTFVMRNAGGEVIGPAVQEGPLVMRVDSTNSTVKVYQRGLELWSGYWISGLMPTFSMVGSLSASNAGAVAMFYGNAATFDPRLCALLSANPWRMFSAG